MLRRGGLAGAFLILAALPSPAADQTSSSVELRGGGSTFAAPLIEAWIGARMIAAPNVIVHYSPVGSSEGIRSFLAGRLEFAVSDRPLSAEEAKPANEGLATLPITAGMVVVAYNLPDITAPLRLGRETLAGIFSGAIREWDNPKIRADNPGVVLPDRTITLVTRREGSGTTYAFTGYLAAVDPSWIRTGPGVGDVVVWPQNAMEVPGNEGVAARIALSEYSIGYMEFGFARRLDLKTAQLQNRDGAFVSANATSGAAALSRAGDGAMPAVGKDSALDPAGSESYPIVTFSWLVMHERSRSPETQAALHDFVSFGLSPQGQAKGAEIGYIPLPTAALAKATTAVRDTQ